MKDQKTVSVRLGQRSYDVLIGRGNIKSAGKLLKNLKIGSRGMLITNTKVKKLYGHMILRVLQRAGLRIHQIIIPDGERHKSFDHLRKIYDRMLRLRFERQSFVVALGGGVVGDLAGFAAAT